MRQLALKIDKTKVDSLTEYPEGRTVMKCCDIDLAKL